MRRKPSERRSPTRVHSEVATPVPPSGGLLPSLVEALDPRGPFLLPLVVLLLSRSVFWMLMPFASEDAYITFRYARSLATGHGLVYNPGEHVMGFSSPLWTVWTAAGIAAFGDPVLWTRASTLIADVVTLLVMGQLLKRHASNTSAWLFNAFFAGWPFFAAVAVSGMENSAMFMSIALSAALIERRHPAGGIALGALAVIRPEGLAAALIIALGARPRDWLVALGIVVLGYGALAWYYGSPIAQSVIAKSKLYGTPGPWLGRHWWDWLSPAPLGRWSEVGEGNALVPLTALFSPALFTGAVALWPKRRSGLALAIGGALSVWLGYAVLGVAYFFWYLVVPLGGLAALAAVGLPSILRGRAVYVALAVMVVGMWTLQFDLYLGRSQNEYFSFSKAADYLVANAKPGQTVMLEPIGIIGYRAPLRVVDEIGLVSPQVMARRLRGLGWYTDLVASEKPEWLVVRRGMLRSAAAFAGRGTPFRSLAERDSVVARYAERFVSDGGSGAGDASLVVMQRLR